MKLYHISEEPDIKIFHPRPSPQHYDSIKGDVVFAVSDKLLHNYLLPRNCPRVTYYKGVHTSEADVNKFFGNSTVDYIINVPEDWIEKINSVKLYKYEFASDNFVILDENAGYYISYSTEIPIRITEIVNIMDEIGERSVELRFSNEIKVLSQEVVNSSLNFSIIRMSK